MTPSPCTFGTRPSPKQKSPSTSCVAPVSTPASQPGNYSMAAITSATPHAPPPRNQSPGPCETSNERHVGTPCSRSLVRWPSHGPLQNVQSMGVATRQIRVVNNQLHWFPQKIAMPIATNLDMIRATLEDLKIAIAAPQSDTPIRNLPDNLRNELSDELTQSFEQHLSQNPQPSIEALLKMLGHPMEEPAPLLGVAPDLPGHSQPPEDQHMPPQDLQPLSPILTLEPQLLLNTSTSSSPPRKNAAGR
jgi:hypothetical protein